VSHVDYILGSRLLSDVMAKFYAGEGGAVTGQGLVVTKRKQCCDTVYLRNRLSVGGGCVYVLQMFFFVFFHPSKI